MGVPQTIQVASFGIPDTLFLMLLALVVFGPRRLPEIGRQLGKLMYEFRKVSNDFKFQMEEELRASEEADRQKKMAAIAPLPAETSPEPPVAEAATLELGAGDASTDAGSVAGNAAETAAETAPAVAGEVRGEPRKFPHIQPPATGETVAAERPFRARDLEEPSEPAGEFPAPDNGIEHKVVSPEGDLEAQASSGQEVHHG